MLRRNGFRHSDRQERRLLRPLLHPHGRDAPVRAHHEAVHRQAARARWPGAGRRRGQQDRTAPARRDEALDGSADPSLQALHRRRARAGRRVLRRGRGAEGRVRRLPGRRRHQQALQVQDPRAGLCPFAGDGFHLQRPSARRRLGDSRLARHCVRRGRSVMAHAPIQFDRASGALVGANAWERLAATALVLGSKVASNFSHRGYNMCANLLRTTLPERGIQIKLNPDAIYEFPYGDGYWSKLLNRTFRYENELELLFEDSADVDYTLLDCGANYGYWSVLVSSKPFGSHKAIAIEPSGQNFPKLANNAKINGNRFELMKCAIGAARGTARLSGTKHEAFSIAGDQSDGEEVPVIALDNLLDDGKVAPGGKYLIKLDVEGVEIEAMKGGARLMQGDSVLLCEEHGNDPQHTVSRYILEQTPLKLIVYDPRSNRLETVTDLSILDRIKVSTHVGYNVFGTASAFWLARIDALNAKAARRAQ